MRDFENKVAIVTGTTGSGRAVSKRLARGGAQVLACGIDTAANAALQDESVAEGLAIEVRRCDVAVPAEIESAFQAATGLFAARTFSPQLPVDQVFQRFGQAHPLGRIGTPEEVANLAAFLASSNASFCTGADYLIDEGLLAGLAVR